jgi:ribosomal protein L34E
MFYAVTIHNHVRRKNIMSKCPQCGKEVKNAKKTWKMAGKPDKAGKRTQLTIGLYECCGKSFRQVLDKKKI